MLDGNRVVLIDFEKPDWTGHLVRQFSPLFGTIVRIQIDSLTDTQLARVSNTFVEPGPFRGMSSPY